MAPVTMQSLLAIIERCVAHRVRLFTILFVVYGLAGCMAAAVLMPPFANIDEGVHFVRADAISLGGLVGVRQSASSAGGIIHRKLRLVIGTIHPIVSDLNKRIDWDTENRTFAITWDVRSDQGSSSIGYVAFPTTAFYPPYSYLSDVVGILLGRAFDLTIAATLLLARAVGSITYVAIGAFAIAGAGEAAPLLFSVLLLPTAIAQGGSASQDSFLFALAALVASLTLAGLRDQTLVDRRRMLVLCVAIGMLVTARPPYLPLAVLPLLLRGQTIWLRLACSLAIVMVCILWSTLMAAFVAVPVVVEGGVSDVPHQAVQLLLHPVSFVSLVVQTLGSTAYRKYVEFVGLGFWWLPHEYYVAAGCILVLATMLCMVSPHRGGWWPQSAAMLGVIGSAAALIFVACYLFTRPDAPEIVGVQGRYFIPLALLIPGVLPAIPMRDKNLLALPLAVIALFPIISIPTLLYAVVWRFYLAT